jgi:hypothetical protein
LEDAQRFAALRRRGFLALNFIRCTKLEFSTSLSLKHETPAFAKRLLPPVLPCLPWFFGLFVASFFIVFCRAVGHFLKFLFLLRWLCKLFDKALVVALACVALAMCLQNALD